jgi:tRNA uridine 5-carboxymethylaminomethyl modification enzyme
MFTSRAEYRLSLRADNADQRLTALGEEWGCIGRERAQAFADKRALLERARELVHTLAATPPELARAGLTVTADGQRRDVYELLGFPTLDLAKLQRLWPELASLRPDIAEQIEIDGRYAGYLSRQEADIRAYRRDEALRLPDNLDYDRVGALSAEMRSKLKAARPATLGAAARLSGVTPAALVALLRHVRRDDRSAA